MSGITTPTAPATAAAPSRTEGDDVPLSVDLSGALRVTDTGGGTADVVTAVEETTLAVQQLTGAGTAGIPSTSRLVSAAATTNATVVKAAAGRVYQITGYNVAGAARYLKLYNKATAPDENDTPRATIAIPTNSAFALDWPIGLGFATGIGYRLTTGSGDTDTGALTAGDIVGLNVHYA